MDRGSFLLSFPLSYFKISLTSFFSCILNKPHNESALYNHWCHTPFMPVNIADAIASSIQH